MKVTRISYSKGMNASKYAQLEEKAKRLGRVRSEVWQRFGAINGVTMRARQIRGNWLKVGRQFDVPANAWKETLRATKADIAMAVEAALGKRRGDSFYYFDGVVLQVDENAARNVKARLYDSAIDRWTPYKKVKPILLERTKGHRLGLLNQDSSCTGSPVSMESESSMHAQECVVF